MSIEFEAKNNEYKFYNGNTGMHLYFHRKSSELVYKLLKKYYNHEIQYTDCSRTSSIIETRQLCILADKLGLKSYSDKFYSNWLKRNEMYQILKIMEDKKICKSFCDIEPTKEGIIKYYGYKRYVKSRIKDKLKQEPIGSLIELLNKQKKGD